MGPLHPAGAGGVSGEHQAPAAILIPARLGSSRLPGKPLADLCGKPLILRVLEQANRVQGVERVAVATDDARIADVVRQAGGEAIMTSSSHTSGTDRLIEAMGQVPAALYMNIQGDEPFFDPAHVEALLAAMRADASRQVGTLCHPITAEAAAQAHQVKVVRAASGWALYFSRAAIPAAGHGGEPPQYLKHVGIYAYRAEALRQFAVLPRSALEQTEQLEQLRFLEAGIPIHCELVAEALPGVDTPECLERARAHWQRLQHAGTWNQ